MYLFFSSASNRIIAAKDHASIQMNIADVSIIIRLPRNQEIFPLVSLLKLKYLLKKHANNWKGILNMYVVCCKN